MSRLSPGTAAARSRAPHPAPHPAPAHGRGSRRRPVPSRVYAVRMVARRGAAPGPRPAAPYPATPPGPCASTRPRDPGRDTHITREHQRTNSARSRPSTAPCHDSSHESQHGDGPRDRSRRATLNTQHRTRVHATALSPNRKTAVSCDLGGCGAHLKYLKSDPEHLHVQPVAHRAVRAAAGGRDCAGHATPV